MILVKIIMLAILKLFIKCISIFMLTFLYLVNRESDAILNKKSYKIDGRGTNDCIRPPVMIEMPKHSPIGKMLYNIYEQFVFNACYMKVEENEKNVLKIMYKKFKIFEVVKLVLLGYIGTTRLFLKLTGAIVTYKEGKIENYLFKKFVVKYDKRLIVKIDNKGVVNGWFRKLKSYLELVKLDHVIKPKDITELQNETVYYQAQFVDKRSRIVHKTFPDLGKDGRCYGYETDYKKAVISENYGLDEMISKYEGKAKESRLLGIDKNELIQVGDERLTSTLHMQYGAFKNGYNSNLVSEEFEINVKDLDLYIKGVRARLIEEGVSERQIDEMLDQIFK